MNFSEMYSNTFINDFNLQLPKIKQAIIEYINNNSESIHISIKDDYLDALLKRKNDPNYMPDFLSVNEDGIALTMLTDDLIGFILNNIPETVQSLTIPVECLDKCPECLKKYSKLKELEIPNYGWALTTEEYKSFINGTNISSINAQGTVILDAENLLNYNYISDGLSMKLKIDNTSITCRSNFFDKTINLSIPITEEGLSIIPNDFFDKDASSCQLLVNGKKIIDKTINGVKIFLSDNIQETKELVTALLNQIESKPESITFVAQNKTYQNINELKPLEGICNVVIKYGLSTASIDQFDAMRKTLDYYKSLILQNDLSQVERICYAYDLIKSNIYRENEEKKDFSRNIHSIVETGNIVCVGYSAFLAQLLKEVGVKAYSISTVVPRTDGSKAGHQRNLIEVNDDKYEIHGIYAFDCTWDSNSNTYKVIREGKEKIVKEPVPTDEVIKQYDYMSRYSYFLIPASEYSLYFPGERQFENINEWNSQEYNPNENTLSELLEKSPSTSNIVGVYNTKEKIEEDKLMKIIYNTRLFEGYSPEINQLLLEEIEEIRKLKAPKELIAEDGMVK